MVLIQKKTNNFNFNKKILVSIIFLVITIAFSFGLEVPKLQGRINDYANIIDTEDKNKLTEYLKRLDDQTGIQIAVLTVPSLEGDSIESFSIDVATEWELGQKGEDNGALFVLALEEHDVRIEIGYGLEGVLTDAKCSSILRNVVIPEFKNGDYSEGILKGITNMVGIALGDQELVDSSVANDKESDPFVGVIIFIVVFIIVILSAVGGYRSSYNPRRRHYYSSPRSYSSSTFSSSSSFHSSSSSSSFSGGGGSFGGGGSSAHW